MMGEEFKARLKEFNACFFERYMRWRTLGATFFVNPKFFKDFARYQWIRLPFSDCIRTQFPNRVPR